MKSAWILLGGLPQDTICLFVYLWFIGDFNDLLRNVTARNYRLRKD